MKKLVVIVCVIFGSGCVSREAPVDKDKLLEPKEVVAKSSPKNQSLLQILFNNSPSGIYFEEESEFPDRIQELQYLGIVGNFKVIKYFAEFGPSHKGSTKLVLYTMENQYYGHYLPFADYGQIYKTSSDSVSVGFVGMSLSSTPPDSVQYGPELWMRLVKYNDGN